jgi:hypothetical protein
VKKEQAVEFVRVWQSCETSADVAKKTGMTVTQVATTARAMRKKGVPLKAYGKSTVSLTQLDWAELIALCDQPVGQKESKPGTK